MRRPAGEEGSILPLIFGFFALAVALVLVATAATSLYLERSRLYTLADGAALAAADSLALDAALAAADPVTAAPGGPATPDALRPAADTGKLRAAAADYLAAATTGRRTAVVLVAAGSPDGRGVRVRVATRWRPPLATAFVPRGVRIEVTANARPVFR